MTCPHCDEDCSDDRGSFDFIVGISDVIKCIGDGGEGAGCGKRFKLPAVCARV